MTRRLLLFALTLATMARVAHADEPAQPPPFQVQEDQPHRFSLPTLGLIGGVGAVSLLVGGGIVLLSHTSYDQLKIGGDGVSCRPCSTSDLATVRAQEYTGYALIGVGAVLVVADAVLIALDLRYRASHKRDEFAERLTGTWRF